MTLDKIAMPDSVRKEVATIMAGIARADSLLELTRLGGFAEGFAQGMTCIGAMRAADIDALEIVFTQAFDRRMAEVRRG